MPLPTLQILNIAQPQPATMKLQAMKMGTELGRLGEMQKRTEIYQSQHGLEKQQFELDRMKTRLSTIRQFIPQVTQDNYDDFIKWGSELGIPEELYPSVEEVKALSPEKFESEKTKFAMDVDDFLKKDLETIKHEHAMELQTQKDAAAAIEKQKDRAAALERAKIAAAGTETKAEKQKKKQLTDLANDYFQQMGRGYSAERGTGQFVPDENKTIVAKKAYDSAAIIAQQYVNAGGKWEDLGIEDPSKTSPEESFIEELTKTHPPAQYKGQTGTDTETGIKYRSDGKNWLEVK